MYKLTLEYIRKEGFLPKGYIRCLEIENKDKFNHYMKVLNTDSWKVLSIDIIEPKPIRYLNRASV